MKIFLLEHLSITALNKFIKIIIDSVIQNRSKNDNILKIIDVFTSQECIPDWNDSDVRTVFHFLFVIFVTEHWSWLTIRFGPNI